MTDKQRQHLLAYLGYYVLDVDGIWGAGSKAACSSFQKDRELNDSGYGNPETDKALRAAVYNELHKPEESEADNNVGGKTGTFWDDVYPIFTRDEFRCKCGGKYCNGFPAEPRETLVRTAYQLRVNLGVPITVVSGLRCETWNRLQGGVDNSQHCDGTAMDVWAKGKTQAQVEAELDRIGGVRYHYPISGSSNVHFDVPRGSR